VEPGFDLQYDSYYACGIEDHDSVYITGGYDGSTTNRVTRYFRDGTFEDMPNLNTARGYHACGSYMNRNQEKVLLVVAGFGSSDYLASTEILVSGSQSWRIIPATYPASSSGIQGLKAISFSNKIIAYGGYSSGNTYHSSIHQFNASTETWTSFGSMLVSRYDHSVDMVNWSFFSKYCK